MTDATNTYTGSCHCGAVTFEVDGQIESLMACNCSICRRAGWLLWGIPRASLRVKGEDNLATYTFNRHVIRHHFCKTCGMHPFGESGDKAAVNARCLDIEDLSGFKVIEYDGKSL
jgi:hypothetical protein